MTIDDIGGDSDDELAFERELIASAGADGVAEEAVQAAWSRFAFALGATATLVEPAVSRGASGAQLVAGGRRALGWISLGAVGGGLATAALIAGLMGRGNRPAGRAGAVPPSASAPAASVAAGAAPGSTARVVMPSSAAPERNVAERSVSARAALGEPPAATARKRRSAPTGEVPARAQTDASTSLADEIALLDDARRASGAGEFDRALALLGRYRHEHPHGELRREGDVLNLETLFLRGDRDEAQRLARQFLEAFPDDPHVAHVRTLAH